MRIINSTGSSCPKESKRDTLKRLFRHRALASQSDSEHGGSAMVRIVLIYSLAMAVAGASLIAESPHETMEPEPTPVRMTAHASSPSGPSPVESPLRRLPERDAESPAADARSFQIDFLVAEVDLAELRQFNPEVQSGGVSVSLMEIFDGKQREFTMTPVELRAIQHCLVSLETMTVLATPSLTAQSGQTARVQLEALLSTDSASGVRPASGGRAANRDLAGLTVDAKMPANQQGAARIHLQMTNGTAGSLPSVPAESTPCDLDVCPGETGLKVLGVPAGSDRSKVTFVAATVRAVNPLRPVAETVPLEPVPEQNGVR